MKLGSFVKNCITLLYFDLHFMKEQKKNNLMLPSEYFTET